MKWLIPFTSFVLGSSGLKSQELDSLDHAALLRADTSHFRVNHAESWMLYNAYVTAVTGDSVDLELILRHANNLDLSSYQLVGSIVTLVNRPNSDREVNFYFQQDKYMIQIRQNGQCYLKLVEGSLPAPDPMILPLHIRFSK